MNKRRFSILALILLSGSLVIAAIKAYSYYGEYLEFIEVCDHGIAYVPRGTKLVKCHGIVKQIIIFETGVTVDEDCACLNLKCCEGLCYVLIETDPETYNNGSLVDSGSTDYRERNIEYSWVKIWISC